jgi:hypothetical protein
MVKRVHRMVFACVKRDSVLYAQQICARARLASTGIMQCVV